MSTYHEWNELTPLLSYSVIVRKVKLKGQLIYSGPIIICYVDLGPYWKCFGLGDMSY